METGKEENIFVSYKHWIHLWYQNKALGCFASASINLHFPLNTTTTPIEQNSNKPLNIQNTFNFTVISTQQEKTS